MTLEFRNAVPIGGELKDLDEKKREVLVSFPHDVRDTYSTSFGTDCFRESFEKRLPAVVWQHSLTEPIGRTISAQVTNSANELVSKFSDFDAVPLARRAFSQLEDGSLTDASFGFVRHAEEKHPEMRGVTRITSATMQEWSPVTIGAIPGAVVTGTRSEEGLVVITVEDIERQLKDDLIDRYEARAMLAAVSPLHRLHIVLGQSAPVVPIEERTDPKDEEPDPEPDPVAAALMESSARKAEIIADAVTEKGTRATSMAAPSMTDDDPDEGDASSLAAATDAALDSAVYWFGKVDLSTLPDEIQQGIALTQAAGVAVDELLDAMGVDDPDDDMDNGRSEEAPEVAEDTPDTTAEAREDPEVEERALTLSTKPWDPKPADYTPAQWKAACLIWDGPADVMGSGSLPVKEPDGTVNKAALAAAAGRLGQVKASDADKTAAAKQLLSYYGAAKLKAPGSLLQAARSVEDPEVREMVADFEIDDLDDLFSRHGIAAA